jgi:hypothetical protein
MKLYINKHKILIRFWQLTYEKFYDPAGLVNDKKERQDQLRPRLSFLSLWIVFSIFQFK